MVGGAVLATGPDEGLDDLLFRPAVRRHVDAPRFVRRDWLAAEVGAALAAPACRLVLLTGEPGAGKSGLLAQLAADHPDWPRYLLRRDQRSPLGDGSARSFLLRVGFQLAATRPALLSSEQLRIEVDQRVGELRDGGSAVAAEVERILASPFHQAVVQIRQQIRTAGGVAVGLRVGEWVADPRLLPLADLASMALLDPARVLARLHPGENLVILVDALDELADDPSGESLRAWLTDTALPPNVRILVTSRPDPTTRLLADRHGAALRQITIEAADQRVRADLATYAHALTRSPRIAAALGDGDAGFVKAAVDKADGNVGYLDALGRALDQADQADLPALVALAELPDTLAGLHAYFLRRLRAGPGAAPVLIDDPATGATLPMPAWPAVFRPLLQTLCVALEPLTLDQLAGLSGTPASHPDVAAAVARMSQFLDRQGDRHRLYHTTFADFMTAAATRADPDTADLHVDVVGAHRALGLRLRAAGERIWADPGAGTPADRARDAYARSHLVAHLQAGQLFDELFATLDDPAHGRGRIRTDPSTFGFCADLDRGRAVAGRPGVPDEVALALLPRLLRYGVLRHSLSSQADARPDDSYVAMALTGRAEQAAQLAQLIAAPQRRAGVFSAMAPAAARAGSPQLAVQLADLAAAEAPQLADPADRWQAFHQVARACGEVLDADVAVAETTLAQLEQLATGSAQWTGTVSGLAVVARLRLRIGDDDGTDRLLGTITGMINDRPGDPGRDAAVADFIELAVDLGDLTAARTTLNAVHSDVWAIVRAATAVAGADPGSAPDVAPILEFLEDAAQGADDQISAGVLNARLATAWTALRRPDRATGCAAAAVSCLEAVDEPAPSAARAIAEELRRLADPALLTRLANRLETVGKAAVPDPKPGHGYQFSVVAGNIVEILAGIGETGPARAVADALPPAQRGGAFEGVARAHARHGRFDEALALADDTARVDASSPARALLVAREPTLDTVDTAERIRCDIVAQLAAAGDTGRALDTARRLQSVAARRYGLSAIAVALADRGESAAALALLDEVDHELRLAPGRPGQFTLAAGLLHIAVAARAWDTAAAMLAERPAMSDAALIDALIDAGELRRAHQLLEGSGGAWEVNRLITLGERAADNAPDAPAITGEYLIARANANERPAARSDALLAVVRWLAPHDSARAETLLYEAVEQLNRVDSFPYRPTPWPTVCEAFVRVGRPARALDLAGQIAAVDPFDGCIAYQHIAAAAREVGAPLDRAALLETADALADRVEFPPTQQSARAAVMAEFAALGQLDRALRDVDDDWRAHPTRLAVARRLAEQGRPTEALTLLPPATGQTRPTDHFAVLAALLDAGQLPPAVELARSITEPTYQAMGLARAARRAPAPHGGELAREALAVLDTVDGTVDEADAAEEVAQALAGCALTDVLLDAVRRRWSAAPDHARLARRVGAAAPLTASRADLAVELAQCQRSVDEFLASI